MMHEQEKSDPSIVAVKSANNFGPPGKESMERREGPKETRHVPDTEPGERVFGA
jgi:hypothetical protein